MRLGLNQSLRTDLQLRLSPQILQRIEVLQLPTLDLAQMIEQELQQNEALEVDTDLEPEAPTQDEADDEFDAALDAYESDDDWRPSRNDEASSRTEVLEATAEAPVTLHDHLREQLDELELSERERALAGALVAALNDRGWLESDLGDLEVPVDPPAGAEELEHALHLVQALEPAGVGCRDLTECLLLQLDPAADDYQLLATLAIQHLDDIAHNRIPRIVRETGATVEQVLAAIDAISHLDPVPGRRFGSTRVPHVRPDVVVRRVGEDFEISLENDWVPSLTISRSYLQMARDRSLDPELRKHLRGKIESARSLIDAVEQRKNTLFRVASELVNRQLEFLEHGKARLRPLRMQEVADVLGVHVSTVSRAISGKYMQTPRGILPMKDLFTGEVPVRPGGDQPDAEAESRASVQERIRKIIGEEDARNPLSDEAIVQMLKDEHDLDIARRTVTKYRKALGLGSSRERRRYGPT
ncbi:MAG: RNA polymerase factor sigma-54 [Planctomycetes bacterium]|nr:RNA polymerase factor sigma-54 [Planctomycetota bacterium]